MSSKKDTGWRKRTVGSVNQIGQAFHLEPHGDRSKLPKSLQQVSFSEIPEALEKRRRKNMTPEEIAEEEMIDQAVQEAIAEREQAEYQKNLLQKLGDALDKRDKKNRSQTTQRAFVMHQTRHRFRHHSVFHILSISVSIFGGRRLEWHHSRFVVHKRSQALSGSGDQATCDGFERFGK